MNWLAMTIPTSAPPPTVPVEEQAALEAALVAAALVTLAPAIAAAVALWWATWSALELAGRAAVGLTFARDLLLQRLSSAIAAVPIDVTERLERALDEHGRGDVGLAELVAGADAMVRSELADTLTLAHSLDLTDSSAATAVAAKLAGVERKAATLAADVANRAHNADVAADARRRGLRLLWVAELDACPHCLAYAGEHVAPGDSFPLERTFYIAPDGMRKPIKRTKPLPYPPLHPRCRCSVRIYSPALSPGLPGTLRREAQRAIALHRGGFMSEPARRRAADALLSGATLLPHSVGRRRAA